MQGLREVARRVIRPNRYFYVPVAPRYNADGLITIHNADFMTEPRFANAYAAGEATGSWMGQQIGWRAYIACWAADHVKHMVGDFVECGVNRGGLARTICEYVDIESSERRFYLLDTYDGLDEARLSDSGPEREFTRTMGGYYGECYDDVVETFKAFGGVRIVRGSVPDTLDQVDTDTVAFLSIDMNNVAPEIAAADFFWDKLVSGGVILLDDYGWEQHIQQKHAFDEFASRRDVQVLSLPTGQGLIFKP